jgi:signal transduction histidine kinase
MSHMGTGTPRISRLTASPYAPAVAAGVLALLAAIQASALAAAQPQAGSGLAANLQVALVLLSLMATLPLAVLRSYPVPAAVVMTASNALSMLALHGVTAAGAGAQLIAAYVLGRSGRQVLAAALTVPFLLLGLGAQSNQLAGVPRLTTVLLASGGPIAAWAGAARRARLAAAEHSQTQAGIAGTLLEHTARGERTRIARELHDVVAHHISMIAVQAETARLTTPGMPAAGAQRLSSIAGTARAALTEMRSLLGVLREDTSDPSADRQPQPGIGQLNDLVDEARSVSGASTRLILSGWPELLDPGVELAAYRIVQEALTNARRHAPGAAVDVELHFGPDTLGLRIRDNGPGPAGQPYGNGLLGMRERATAVGGNLHTGPAIGGGFLVEAWLPAKAGQRAAP